MRTLVAWIDDRRVGEFTEEPVQDGSVFAFQYDAGACARDCVSLTMIAEDTRRRFETRSFPAPFDMILPEGERRQRIEEARKILRADAFSLLSYVGGNPVNRVRFLPPGAVADRPPPELPTPKEIADCEEGRSLFKRLLEDLDLRQGIAGVQPKILGVSRDTRKLSPDLRHHRGSTHILKSSTARYPFLAVNEHTCLSVFKAAGLQVPNTLLSADGELLLVERFDVRADGTHMGFEEAAALMGATSATKYDDDYGSMLNALADFVDSATEEALRRQLAQAIVLNSLLGNGDAHLKNFGLVYSDDLQVRLAPFYDCVSTIPYIPGDIPALPLSFEYYSKAWWPRAKLEEFAQTYGGLSHKDTVRMIDESIAATSDGIRTVRAHVRRIPAFKELGGKLITLWNARSKEMGTKP